MEVGGSQHVQQGHWNPRGEDSLVWLGQGCTTRGPRKKPGCHPLDPAETVSILAHNCDSCDRLA